jgi:low affinity Fe/Cu permease
LFGKFAASASDWLGSKWAFAGAGLVIVIWAAVGPIFHFSDTWQLVINTGTTIVTFLMVFLIQNTQNRDARAINLKLNELIRAIDKARDQMIDIETLSDLELDELQAKYEKIKSERIERQARGQRETVTATGAYLSCSIWQTHELRDREPPYSHLPGSSGTNIFLSRF